MDPRELKAREEIGQLIRNVFGSQYIHHAIVTSGQSLITRDVGVVNIMIALKLRVGIVPSTWDSISEYVEDKLRYSLHIYNVEIDTSFDHLLIHVTVKAKGLGTTVEETRNKMHEAMYKQFCENFDEQLEVTLDDGN